MFANLKKNLICLFNNLWKTYLFFPYFLASLISTCDLTLQASSWSRTWFPRSLESAQKSKWKFESTFMVFSVYRAPPQSRRWRQLKERNQWRRTRRWRRRRCVYVCSGLRGGMMCAYERGKQNRVRHSWLYFCVCLVFHLYNSKSAHSLVEQFLP